MAGSAAACIFPNWQAAVALALGSEEPSDLTRFESVEALSCNPALAAAPPSEWHARPPAAIEPATIEPAAIEPAAADAAAVAQYNKMLAIVVIVFIAKPS